MTLYVQAEWSKRTKTYKKPSVMVGKTASFCTLGPGRANGGSGLAKWKIAQCWDDISPHSWGMVMIYDSLCNQVENRPWACKRLVEAHDRALQRKFRKSMLEIRLEKMRPKIQEDEE